MAAQYASGKFTPLSLDEAVCQSAYLYRVLTAAGIKVIRVGLQPDAELCAPGQILAGPFHPSMGELVQSYLLRERLTPLLAAVPGDAVISFPAGRESQLRGQKNANIRYWAQRFAGKKILLRPGAVSEIAVQPARGSAEGGHHAAM